MKMILGVLGVGFVLALTAPATTSAAEKGAAQPAAKAPAAAPVAAPAAAPAAVPVAAAPAAPMKAGDTAFVCACGAACKCKTIQSKPGACACGSPLVKATVVKVEKDQIVAQRDGQPAQTYPAPK